MRKVILLTTACLLALPEAAVASSSSATKKSGTLEKSCDSLGQVTLCFKAAPALDDLLLRVAGKRTRILTFGADAAVPYEIEQRGGGYRVKVGARSRSDVPFFAYTEVVFRKVGRSYLVDRYTIATDSECEGSPDIRMIYEFDLRRRTMAAILAPPWSNDGKVHRFVRSAILMRTDLFHLSDEDFVKLLADRPAAAVQRLCSA